MGDFLRFPRMHNPLPDVSEPLERYGRHFDGLRLPGGSMNPWSMGNEWINERIRTGGRHAGDDGSVDRSDVSLHTPEYVAEHRQALGMSENTPDRDFITEVIAHQVTGESDGVPMLMPGELRSDHVARMHQLEGRNAADLSDDEREELQAWERHSAQLRSWGYNPEITSANEVYNEDTGMYAVRYDPLQEGDEGYDPDAGYDPERGSITSFAGTHSLQDGRVDFDREVGSLQYERNQEQIQALIHGGTGERQTITGHSLGGYLAQRAAVDATDQIDEVVTFQAGGLSHEHAQQFEDNRGDIAVRHHSSSADFVHLAGEERLRGDTFHHHSDDAAFGHLYTLMCGTDDDVMHSTGVDEGTTEGWDQQDRRLLEMGRRGVSGVRHAMGLTLDPMIYATEGLGRQAVRLGEHGDEALGHLAEGHGSALRHAVGAGGQALDTALHGDATATLDAIVGGGQAIGGDVVRTGGALLNEASEAGSDLVTGLNRERRHVTDHVLDQGSELIRDVVSTGETAAEFAGESVNRQMQWVQAAGNAASEMGSDAYDAGSRAVGSVVDGAASLIGSLWD